MSGSNGKAARAGDSLLTVYLEEINRVPLLSRKQEDSLARRARRGDAFAREKLIRANLRFVVSVAKSFQMLGLPLEDLVSEGNIGLMKAMEHFDPGRGYHFISYAVWWIRQAIMRAIAEKSRIIRLPQNKAAELFRIVREREDLQGEHSLRPEAEAIARRLKSKPERVQELLSVSRDLLSLEAPVRLENDSSRLEDLIEDRNSRHPEEILIESSLRDDINRALKTLSQRESEVLQYRFGLNGHRPMTLKAIGVKCRLTKERIRQIEKRAIKRLRHPSCSRLLRPYS